MLFRSILDAAPVKQNVPPEVLAELRKNRGDYSRMVEILHEFVDSNKAPTIKDPVKVISVDLSQYDRLGLGREVNQI